MTMGALVGWAVVLEHRSNDFLDDVARAFQLLQAHHGNLDRPLGMKLLPRRAFGSVAAVGDAGCSSMARTAFTVDAVMRGEAHLWHLEHPLPAGIDVGGGIIVVERAWRGAVREARGLEVAQALTPRLLVYLRGAPPPMLASAAARDDLCAAMLSPMPACCLVVEPADNDGPGRVFLELPREGLRAADFAVAVARLEVTLAALALQTCDRLRCARPTLVTTTPPSGSPVVIPA